MEANAHSARRPAHVRILTLVVTTLIVVAACGVDDTGLEVRASNAPRVAPDPTTVPATVAAVNAFGLDVQRAFSHLRAGNLVITPWITATTLAMMRTGATGETRDQFDRVLHAPPSLPLDEGLNSLGQMLASRNGDRRSTQRKGQIRIDSGAALWAPRGTTFSPSFLQTLTQFYDRGPRVVDFRSDPETARTAINRWAADTTSQAITQLASRGSVTDVTQMFGTAVLYPRAPWELRFSPDRTRPGRFTVSDGETVDPPTMQLTTDAGLLYARGDGYEAIELAYLGQELALLIIVPDHGSFESFAAGLNLDRFDQIVQSLKPTAVDLRLPRFAFTSDLDLDDALRSLGLTDAFDDRRATFDAIATSEALSLSGVAHQAFVSIDEEGTQARAATVQAPMELPPPGPATTTRLAVDRPFLFALRDRPTGTLLALGQVINPMS